MIRIQKMPAGSMTAIGRYYTKADADPMGDYVLLFVLNWEINSKEVWIHGMMGTSSHRALRELVVELREMGFEYIRALRQEHRVLPRAKPHPDGLGLVIRISDFLGDIDKSNEVSGFASL